MQYSITRMLKTFFLKLSIQCNLTWLIWTDQAEPDTNPSTWLNLSLAKKDVGLENSQHEVSLVELGLEDIDIELG